jgi:hypothetical protein
MTIARPNLALKTAACGALLERWLAWRGDRLMPQRSDVDPLQLKSILPHIVIVEIRAQDLAIVRLAGTAYREMFGLELTGRNIIDLASGEERRIGAYRNFSAAAWPCGRHAELSYMYSKGLADTFEFLSLPMEADRPGEPRMLINAMQSVLGRRWLNEPVLSIAGEPGDFTRYLDIGAGVPPSLDPPDDFIVHSTRDAEGA